MSEPVSEQDQTPFSFCESVRYRFYCLVAGVLSRFSPAYLDRLARLLGAVFWGTMKSRRNRAVEAVQKHLDCPKERAEQIARASFTENCRSFLEIFHVGHYDEQHRMVRIIPEEILDEFRRETAPVVAATAHIGSWEVMAAMVNVFHPERYKMVVVRTQRDRALAKLMKKLRGARGMEPVGHRQAATVVMEALRKKAIVAFLVDHNCSRKEAVFLPFLGDTAAVNSGPAMLALRSKAVVYPMFNIRGEGGNHIFHLYPPLRTAELKGSISERVEAIAKYYTDCVADIVRKYPEQWLWMHNRWKTRP